MAFKPRRGDALLFWSIKPDGVTEDPLSEHEGCPVVKGVKWTATVWVHNKPFRADDFNPDRAFKEYGEQQDPGVCSDLHRECPNWRAKVGGAVGGKDEGKGGGKGEQMRCGERRVVECVGLLDCRKGRAAHGRAWQGRVCLFRCGRPCDGGRGLRCLRG